MAQYDRQYQKTYNRYESGSCQIKHLTPRAKRKYITRSGLYTPVYPFFASLQRLNPFFQFLLFAKQAGRSNDQYHQDGN